MNNSIHILNDEDDDSIPALNDIDFSRPITMADIERIEKDDPEMGKSLRILESLKTDPESIRIFEEAKRLNATLTGVNLSTQNPPATLQDAFELSEEFDSGIVWKYSWGQFKAGEPAGSYSPSKGWRVGFKGTQYPNKDVVWMLAGNPALSESQKIAFLDEDSGNCRLSNLVAEEATRAHAARKASSRMAPAPAEIPNSDFIPDYDEFDSLVSTLKEESPKLIRVAFKSLAPHEQAAVIKLLRAIAD